MNTDGRSDLRYRADIDGLRAIAVLAVALYHAETPGFSGGFIGVDIFFVISGYLITRIIASETAAGSFSFWSFYERRVRRLLPALFLVAAAVIVFTLLYRSPRDADIFGESITLFALFAANAFFYNQLDYFADPVEFYPLLHTWSLAVEEQFYLVWPVVIVAVWRWRSAWLRPVLAGIVLVSFIAAVIAVAQDPQLAFFHTPFRMWQLGLGGLIALSPPLLEEKRWRELAAALGLLLSLAPIALYDDGTPFPGLAAAPPTLGAALIIASGVGGGGAGLSVIGRALSFGPLVFIGLCSYSFYLWHWPALSAARYLSFTPLSHLQALAVLMIAFALAAATWRFVERPFRRPGGVLPRSGLFAGAAGGIVLMLLLGWALQETRGLPGRFPELASMFSEDARRYGPAKKDCAPLAGPLPADLARRLDPRSCLLHRAGADRPVVALWGDSHAWALAPGVAEWAKAEDLTLFVLWSPSCPPFVGVDRAYQSRRFFDCARHNAGAIKAVKELGADRALLAAQWSGQSERLDFASHVQTTTQALRQAGIEPVLIGEAPPPKAHTPTIAFRAARIGAEYPLPLDRTTLEAPIKQSKLELSQAAAAADAPLVEPADLLCPGGVCRVLAADGGPNYADGHHLNRLGARSIGAALGRKIQESR